MVYCDQDMCESKLGRLMQAFRADRPDEWSMDEFIGMAESMHKEIERLRQYEKEAARYRWLRDKACHSEWHTVGSADPSEWDCIVDEYIEESGDGSNN